MTNPNSPTDKIALRRNALSRWENEGGAIAPVARQAPPDIPDLGSAEIVQLRIRVIALENLLIAILANGSEAQLGVAREMASYILPRPGVTQHALEQFARPIT